MNSKNKFEVRLGDLRQRAEAQLGVTDGSLSDASTDNAMQRVLHDLHVHQIELEMQNEALRETRQQTERSRDQFMHLYHSAPVGYVVTDENGMIIQANITFSQMIGRDLSTLFHKPLSSLILDEDQAIFLSRFKAFYNNPAGKHLDVRLSAENGKNGLRRHGRPAHGPHRIFGRR